ncbi:MAG: hypothetical protein J6L02_02260 [Bacteroidales bacterium]|nr:hypothetical protein [Bacteroidales bacterium]
MKRMKLVKAILATLLTMFIGAVAAVIIGVSPILGSIGFVAASVVTSFIGGGVAMSGLYPEIWTGEMIKAFRNSVESVGWYKRIPSVDNLVGKNNTINFADLGGDPTVLINNTTYPIGVETLEDANKAISLDKYQTKATKITDDELRGVGYDKIGSVLERHREAIDASKYAKAIHAIAPTDHAQKHPVILTTGEKATEGGRKKITRADILSLKATFDKLKVPVQGRVLVLCSDHANDLLAEDQKFAEQFYNLPTGKILNQYGFDIYEFADAPYYTVSSKKKVAFGTAISANDRYASVAFFAPRARRADGETKTYLQDAKTSPTTQENLVNVRHYSICLPLRNEAIGAIVSDIVTA